MIDEIAKNLGLAMKRGNSPNFLHLRPIEIFWALYTRAHSKLSKTTHTLGKFRFWWKQINNEVVKSSGNSLMADDRERMKYEADDGLKSNWFMETKTSTPVLHTGKN